MSIIQSAIDIFQKPLWLLSLVDSTWKGNPFQVKSVNYNIGQRLAVKELPYRNMPRVEPMGMKAQYIQVSGFLIGDDVWDQRDQMIRIAKDATAGEVIIPSRGPLVCRLENVSFSESQEEGNRVGVDLSFIVVFDPDTVDLPDNSNDPFSLMAQASGNLKGSLSADFAAHFQADRSAYLGKRTLQTVAANSIVLVRSAIAGVELAGATYTLVQNATKPRYGLKISGNAASVLGAVMAGAQIFNNAIDRVNAGVALINSNQNAVQSLAIQQVNLANATGGGL